MNNIFTNAIYQLNNLGVLDVIIPFILLFTVVFGVLSKTPILKEKKFNVMVALSIALIPIFNHVLNPNGPYDIIPIMNNAVTQVGLVIVAIIMLLLIVGIFGGKTFMLGENKASGWIIAVAVIIILYIFFGAAGWGWYDLPYWLHDSEVYTLIVALLVFGLVIKYVTAEKEEKDKTGFFGELAKLMKDNKEK